MWKNLAPPTVELLMRLILLERINTKDRLYRFNHILALETTCVLCSEGAEFAKHLFFAYPIAWMFWYKVTMVGHFLVLPKQAHYVF